MAHSHSRVVPDGTACLTGVKEQHIISCRGMGDITVFFQANVAGVVYIQPLRPVVSTSVPRVPYSDDDDDDGIPETWPDMAASEAVVADTPVSVQMFNFGFVDCLVGFYPAADGLIAFFDQAVRAT